MRLTEPSKGAEFSSPHLAWHVGGAEANVAAGLVGLGHAVRLISVAPDNPAGDAARRILRGAGVDVSHMLKVVDGRLGLYFHAGGAGHRPGRITYDRDGSAFALALASDFDFQRAFADCAWLHISGVTPAIGANAAEAACQAAQAAVEMGMRVSFDFNYRAKMWARWGGDPAPFLNRLVASADVLFANDHDLAHVVDIAESDRGRTLNRGDLAFAQFPRLSTIASAFRTVKTVERQSLRAEMVTRAGRYQTQSVDLDDIVDRIGAGDAFASALISAILRGTDSQRALDEALAAGVLAHMTPGDLPANSQEDLDNFCDLGPADVRR